MKKNISIIVLISSMLSASTLTIIESGDVNNSELEAVALATPQSKVKKNYKEVTLKSKGKTYTIQVEVKNHNNTQDTSKDTILDKLQSKVGFIISFKNITDIDTFAATFDLKMVEKMAIGDYIFENKSNMTDIVLIQKILSSSFNDRIVSIAPNWPGDAVPN